MRRVLFSADNFFEPQETGEIEILQNIIYKTNRLEVTYENFNHIIPSYGYSIKEINRFKIHASYLEQNNIPAGSWLGNLKRKFISHSMNGKSDFENIDFSDIIKQCNEKNKDVSITKKDILTKIISKQHGDKIVFITDVRPLYSNIKKAIRLAKNANLLYLESTFQDQDKNRAIERGHLYNRVSRFIAEKSNAETFIPIHISPIYK
jgi:ribonuclease Z